MAIRTNSAKARQRIRQYILDSVNDPDYLEDAFERFNMEKSETLDFPTVSKIVMSDFEHYIQYMRPVYNLFDYFEEWSTGLTAGGLFDYYLRSYCNAIDILGDILEETEEERNKFTYTQAEHLLTSLIYAELLKGKKEYAKNSH
jgi:hypothetical protein